MTFKFSNNAESTLASPIGSGDTAIALDTGGGAVFPALAAGETFEARIVEGSTSEWITVTARASDQLTATRDPASPQSFSAGANIMHTMSANMLNSFLQQGDFRTVTSDPNGSLAASYFGEEVFQSVTGIWWKHTTGTVWQEMNYYNP
jgi:hypothetical protein